MHHWYVSKYTFDKWYLVANKTITVSCVLCMNSLSFSSLKPYAIKTACLFAFLSMSIENECLQRNSHQSSFIYFSSWCMSLYSCHFCMRVYYYLFLLYFYFYFYFFLVFNQFQDSAFCCCCFLSYCNAL